MTRAVLLLCLFAAACKPCNPTHNVQADSAVDASMTMSRLHVTNKCEIDIWVQQQGFPGSALVHLDKGKSHDYDIPAEGLASTRFWPKMLCDSDGNNCRVGQSSPPCGTNGCAPPVDSKLEATWGCTLKDHTKCGKTPQGITMIDTYWNASAVDGYTLPFTMAVRGGDGRASCIPVDCSGLAKATCPTDDDLSNGGKNPAYAHQDLRVANGAGCFSTCTKLNYPGWGGDGLNAPSGPVEQMYCCPTPPISSPQCQAGPVPKTKYVGLIHKACKNTTYGYAYDDGIGGRNCSGDTVIEFTVGPGCVQIN